MQNTSFPPTMNLGNLLEPGRQMARLMIDQTDKLIGFQMECARNYNEMAMEDLRAALSVSDADSLRNFVDQHNKIMTSAARRCGDDLQAVADMTRNFGEQAGKIGAESATSAAQATGSEASRPKSKAETESGSESKARSA